MRIRVTCSSSVAGILIDEGSLPGSGVSKIHVVRELVLIARTLAGKMIRELAARLGYAMDEAAREVAVLEPRRHRRRHGVPEILTHLGVDALVAQHHEGPAGRNHEEEDAVALRGPVHAQARECPLSRAPNVAPEERRDRHADLARRAPLRLLDGPLDRLRVNESFQCPPVHGVSVAAW